MGLQVDGEAGRNKGWTMKSREALSLRMVKSYCMIPWERATLKLVSIMLRLSGPFFRPKEAITGSRVPSLILAKSPLFACLEHLIIYSFWQPSP